MARAKATTSDIFARLARGECANFRNAGCQGLTPCLIVDGQPCDYFNAYVKPLLDYPEFANRYSREAKITVALNPKAKVVRRRRQNAEPALALDAPATPKARTTAPPQSATAKPAGASKPSAPATARQPRKATTAAHATQRTPANTSRTRPADQPITTVVSVSGTVRTKPAATTQQPVAATQAVTAKKATGVVRQSLPEPAPQLLLELTPDAPKKSTAQRRR